MSDTKVIPAGSLPPEPEDTVVEEQVVEEQAPEEIVEETPEEKEERLYADKYKTPEELEKSYKSLSSKIGEQGKTIGDLAAEKKLLMEQLQQLQSMKQPKAEDKKEPATDYDKLLQGIQEQMRSGDLDIEDGVLQISEITRQRTEAVAEAKANAVLDQATNKFQEILSEKEQQKVVEKFHEQNPEFEQWKTDGSLDQVMQTNPLHDEFSAFYAMKAQRLEAEKQAAFEAGKAEAARLEKGSEPVKKVLSKPGQSIQTANKQNKPLSKDELRASMLKAVGVEE